MTLWHAIGLTLAVLVAIYLAWALLGAEDFE
jgi:hypothetical protein